MVNVTQDRREARVYRGVPRPAVAATPTHVQGARHTASASPTYAPHRPPPHGRRAGASLRDDWPTPAQQATVPDVLMPSASQAAQRRRRFRPPADGSVPAAFPSAIAVGTSLERIQHRARRDALAARDPFVAGVPTCSPGGALRCLNTRCGFRGRMHATVTVTTADTEPLAVHVSSDGNTVLWSALPVAFSTVPRVTRVTPTSDALPALSSSTMLGAGMRGRRAYRRRSS